MSRYLLSTYGSHDDVDQTPRTPEEMQAFMDRIIAVESDMDDTGTFVFGGALHGPDAATVVRGGGEVDAMTTDGPFVESKEHIAGFYIIEAADLDDALVWARRVSDATGRPIEVRPFFATGRVAEQSSGTSGP